jgi:F-type H+-transporting ATPase subunit gamma
MSLRRRIERQVHGLDEIKDIMTAMRNLSVIETRKLARVLETQRRVVGSVRAAAADFGRSYPELLRAREARRADVWLVVGAERGFCGDFNETLLRALPEAVMHAAAPALLVAGSKLAARLPRDVRVIERLPGAAALEDVPGVLLAVMQALERWQAARAPGAALRLTVLHHAEAGRAEASRLDPFAASPAAPPAGDPPMLYLAPERFFVRLLDHFVFAALYDIFYRSLAAENERRIQHMDYAVRRIEQKTARLTRRLRGLRQEEITEEIEVILLSAEATGA